MSSRLKHITKLAFQQSACTVVDCGCDHGKVLYWLLKENSDCRAIAIDKSSQSLEKARKLLECFGNRVAFFCADGLTCLGNNTYNLLIISGIGGYNIVDILTVSKAKFDRIILSPHRDIDLVKRWLTVNNYVITTDIRIECRGKEYTILESKDK